MGEIWKAISGYEGLYAVSNWGRVKSLYDGRHKIFREKLLSPGKDGKGYLRVWLSKEGSRKIYKVHRLVLSTFSPVENMNELQVNHINEKRDDNRLQNLEWCTCRYNNTYNGKHKRVGEKESIPIVQLDLYTNKVVNVWGSSMEAARGGYHQSNIIQCCKGKRNTQGGFRWCYLYEYISKIDSRIKKIILFDKEYIVN